VTINLHIERLVLEGLPMGASDKLIFLASFEVELARLLRNGGVPGHLRAAAALARTHVGTAVRSSVASKSPARCIEQCVAWSRVALERVRHE
jgi:hypothetical protein